MAQPVSPIHEAPMPCAGGTANGKAALEAPGLPQGPSPALADALAGGWQHPLSQCGMETGMGSPRTPKHVAPHWLSARRGLDLAISVWGHGG